MAEPWPCDQCLGRGRESNFTWAESEEEDLQGKLGCCHPKERVMLGGNDKNTKRCAL